MTEAATQSGPPCCRQCGRTLPEGKAFCDHCGTRVVPAEEALAAAREGRRDPFPGMTLLGRYRVQGRLGAGSMGTVYEAEHLALQKTVAVKILHPTLQLSEDAVRRFQQEGVIAGRFHHPGAIEVFDFDRDPSGVVFLAMERIDGRTLRQVVQEQGPFPPRAAVELMSHILDVLAAAHREGIVHRDLKPDNVMLVEAPTPEASVKVLDFGVSKILDFHNENTLLTQTGQILGTPLYMSPEQCNGDEVDARSDVYAAGLLLHELVAGTPPFSGRNLTELLMKHTTGEVVTLSDACPGRAIPHDLERIVLRALEKDPARRFADAAEMRQALLAVRFDRLKSRSAMARTGRRLGRALARRPGLVLGAVALALLVGAAGWVLFQTPAAAESARVSARPDAERTARENRYLEHLVRVRDAVLKEDGATALTELGLAEQEFGGLDAEGLLLRGRARALAGDTENARADFDAAAGLEPDRIEAGCATGWLLRQEGDFPEAERWFREAEEKDGSAAEPHLGLGALALDAHRLPEARTELTAAAERDTGDWRVHLLLGDLLISEHEPDQALQELEEAQRLQPRDPEVHVALSRLHQQRGDLDAAEKAAEAAVQINPDRRESAERRAYVLLGRGRTDDAATVLGDWLRRHPEDAGMQLLQAVAKAEAGDEEAALALLDSCMGQRSREVEGWVLKGTLEHRLGRLDDARESFESALLLDDAHMGAHRGLGFLLLDQEAYREAAPHLEAAAADSSDPQVLFALGVLHWEYLGDQTRGREWFRVYRDAGGTDPMALSIAGEG